jgi:hypothetical protein
MLRHSRLLRRLVSENHTAREGTVVNLTLIRRIGAVLAAASLCVALAGCAVDVASPKSEKTDGSNQLRYYGGPKYPMWSSQ